MFDRQRVACFVNIERIARRKLEKIEWVGDLEDLLIPPDNRLECLKGDRKNQYSIRINPQRRICFHFEKGHAFDVEIVDYH